MIIYKQALKRIFQNKTRLVLLLIMPLLFIMMFALHERNLLTVGIVDKDRSAFSERLVDRLERTDNIKLMKLDENMVYDKAVSYQTDYAVIIEPGFGEKLLEAKNPDIKEFYITEKEELYYARMVIENYIYNVKILSAVTGSDKAAFAAALDEYENGRLSVEIKSETVRKLPQSRSAMGFLVQFMLYMSVLTAGIILEDKSSGVFYRVFYSAVSLKRYLSENLLAFLTAAFLQVTVILVLLKTLWGLELGDNPLNMYLLFIVFSLVCVSFGVWLVSLVKKPLHAYIINFLAAGPIAMLGGCFWPMDYMPDIMKKIAWFMPSTWVMDGVDKFLYEGKNIAQISSNILILLIFTGIFMAAGLFKRVDISK